MVIRLQGGLELGRFGYRSRSPDTTTNRGYFGSLLSALAWRDRHAPSHPVNIKTTLQYVYDHFRNGAEGWLRTGKTASKKPVQNLDLVKGAFELWQVQDPIATLMRTPDVEVEWTERAKDIAKNMRDHGGMTRLIKPGEPDDFDVVEEDMDDLISRAVDRDFRHEQRRLGLW